MKLAVRWIAAAVLASGITLAHGQGAEMTALQDKLNASFKLSAVSRDETQLITPGDMVELQKDGFKMSALPTVPMESSTYKDGKIGGGTAKRVWGGLGVAMLAGMANVVPDMTPGHTLKAGERCWVEAIQVQKDGVNFKLYMDASVTGMAYHANLKIFFPDKKHLPPMDAALSLVAEVLKVVPPEPTAAPEPAADAAAPPLKDYEDVAPPPAPPGTQPYENIAPPPPPQS
jgi:hypothetical protein